MAHFVNRRFDAALPALQISLEEVPAFAPTYRTMAACFVRMGRLDEARSILNRLVALTPVVLHNVNPFRNPEHGELFLSGLRLAMAE
jgi:pentatricopeptide repeat protein